MHFALSLVFYGVYPLHHQKASSFSGGAGTPSPAVPPCNAQWHGGGSSLPCAVCSAYLQVQRSLVRHVLLRQRLASKFTLTFNRHRASPHQARRGHAEHASGGAPSPHLVPGRWPLSVTAPRAPCPTPPSRLASRGDRETVGEFRGEAEACVETMDCSSCVCAWLRACCCSGTVEERNRRS